jgi:probable HAF family extracellular repeat protein
VRLARGSARLRLPLVGALLVPWLAAVGHADPPTFAGVGELAGGAVSSTVFAISADGAVVVGESAGANGTEAFRWTAGGGIEGLGFLSNATPFSSARAVSADGSVIAGSSNNASGGRRAYRYSAGAFTALNTLSCSNCDPVTEGWGVSGNGQVVVGSATARPAIGALHVDPVRWPNAGTAIVDLGNLATSSDAGEAYGASDTGALIAGSHTSSEGRDAWYWNGSGLVALPRLAVVTKVTAGALAVARDAGAIVGYCTRRTVTLPGGTVVSVEPQAVRWSGVGFATIENLGVLADAPSIDSRALAVSPDGTLVVGRAIGAGGGNRAFFWDAAHGMRDLTTVLASDFGLDLTGWVLSEARGIAAPSGAAITLVGNGVNPQGNPEGWVARDLDPVALPEPGGPAVLLFGILALGALARPRSRR